MKQTLTLLLIWASLWSHAQSSAFISRDKLFPMLKGYTLKQATADTLRLQLSREVQGQQNELQKRYEALVLPYSPKQTETMDALQERLSTVDKEKFKLLQEERKLQETRIKSFNKQLEEQYNRDLKPYLTQVENAVQQYAQKNKLEAVWYLEDVVKAMPYYSKTRDITALIAEAVNKNLP